VPRTGDWGLASGEWQRTCSSAAITAWEMMGAYLVRRLACLQGSNKQRGRAVTDTIPCKDGCNGGGAPGGKVLRRGCVMPVSNTSEDYGSAIIA
jgi:hypothetical protein